MSLGASVHCPNRAKSGSIGHWEVQDQDDKGKRHRHSLLPSRGQPLMDTLEVPLRPRRKRRLPATRQHPRTINFEWPRKLHFRRGGKSRLRGIEVYYDFDWETVLGHDRSTFHNGKRLAELAQEDAHGKTPALLLTTRKDVQEKRTRTSCTLSSSSTSTAI